MLSANNITNNIAFHYGKSMEKNRHGQGQAVKRYYSVLCLKIVG
jgi:hypothetical protein